MHFLLFAFVDNFPEKCHPSYLVHRWNYCDNHFSHCFPTESIGQSLLEV